MKKKLLLILLLIPVMILSLTSCDVILGILEEKLPAVLEMLGSLKENLPPVGEEHSWSKWELQTDADNCENDVYERHCLDCDKVETKKGSHEYRDTLAYNETHHWNKCSNCDHVKSKEKHNPSNSVCALCGYNAKTTKGIVYEIGHDGTYAYVSGYTGKDTDVVIAMTYNGVPVTFIDREAFYMDSITSVVIPDSVTYIDAGAFWGCSNLTNVTIGNSVTEIGDRAFYNCSKLTSVTIPDSITSIGTYAFYGCPITVYEYGEYIGDEKNPFAVLISITNQNPSTYKIHESTKIIAESAFENCARLTNITIPDSVTSIDSFAFYGCSKLTSITIPDSVTSIGDDTFYDCYKLTSITIPDSVTSIGNCAFLNCSSLTSITIPDSVTSIGAYAFRNCSSLTSITIPDGVTSIDSFAFYGCSKLTSITIPDSVTSIDSFAFYGCPITVYEYGEYIGDEKNPFAVLIGVTNQNLSAYKIHESTKIIAGSAFENCARLTNITIPDSVTSISYEAFYNCSALTSITIPDSITYIGDRAFNGCSALTSITIPDGVTSIGMSAFWGCSALTDVYHTGSEAEWAKIGIDSYGNDYITNATIHYNYVPEE